MSRLGRLILAFSLSLFVLAPVWVLTAGAATVVTMSRTGTSLNRVDLVILGDGYKAAEMAKFRADAEAFRSKFFAITPYLDYARFFNVRRIETASQESGAGQGSAKNTVYGAFYNCFQTQRLLCIDEAKVDAVLNANLPKSARDMVIVIVNDDEYGGSGGRFAVASTNVLAGDIAIHEFGHSFGRLDDEYVDTFSCGRFVTPVGGFNVSKQSTRDKMPWKLWIDPATPMPTPDTLTDAIGAFEGAFYCPTGWFRPTFDSMMRSLGNPLGPVNGEQIIRRIYAFTNPIDKVSPKIGTIRIARGTSKVFKVFRIDGKLPSLKITWRLGTKVIGTGTSVTIKASQLGGKRLVLKVSVRDRTAMVRSDPAKALLDVRSWTLTP